MRSDRAVPTTELQRLCAVRDRLEERLHPCDDPLLIQALISQFLIGFEHGHGASELNVAALNERYAKALKGVPLAAIEAAIDRFESARTLLPWNRAFRPNPAEVAAEAREGLTSLRKMLVHVRRVIDAEVYDPPTEHDAQRVAAAARDWTENRRAEAEGRDNPVVSEEEFEARLRRIGSLKGVTLSSEALQSHHARDRQDA